MTLNYPLRFQPLFRRYLWGGRRLETILAKPLESGTDYAESWEVVDHGEDQSVVAGGPLAGRSLAQLVDEFGRDLLGDHFPSFLGKRFPLLFKFLDCQQTLSVQVHPNDQAAALLQPPDLGKTEAWVILCAEPGSVVYSGLQTGVDREKLQEALRRGTVENCLHRFEPRKGDCIFIPAGTVHALGAGLVVAEIQQSSDTTYRLHDWNRLSPNGLPRPLHIDAALKAIDYQAGPVGPVTPQTTSRPNVERLVTCDKFILNRWTVAEPQTIGGDNRFHIVAVIDGEITIDTDPNRAPLRKGNVALLPAACQPLPMQPRLPTILLDAHL